MTWSQVCILIFFAGFWGFSSFALGAAWGWALSKRVIKIVYLMAWVCAVLFFWFAGAIK